ncbi:hypothetical protein D3C86_1982130 [compost metagenome]
MQAQLLVEQHPCPRPAFPVDYPDSALLQVGPAADSLRIALLHIEACTARQHMHYDI